MTDTALTILTSSCPLTSDVGGDCGLLPSQWLTSGFVSKHHDDGSITWQKLSAHEVAPDHSLWMGGDTLEAFFQRPDIQAFLERLAATFEQFFALSPDEWKADLRSALNPITSLYLWETVVDVFDYYTKGKHFSRRALREHFETLWLFFNHGPEAAGYSGRTLHSLQATRVRNIADELQSYFHRRKRPRP